MKKILVIQTAFIGDVILATSLIEVLKQEFPQAQIDFLLRKGNESLIQTNPHLNQILIWDKKNHKFLSLFKNLLKIRKEKYDLVLNIQRFLNSGILTAFSGAKQTVGFDKNPLSFLFTRKIEHQIPHQIHNGYYHEVERNLQLAQRFISGSYSKFELKPKLYFDQHDEQKIKDLKLSKKYIVLAPASVWYTKQWHISKWQELIDKVSIDIQIVLIGAPTDLPHLETLSRNSGELINLAGKLSLRQSALLMQQARRVFVNDSAPLHLASSVNAHTTAIFCSTIPDFGYGPLSDDSKLIQLEPRLECMPCGLHGKKTCPLGHFKCSQDIDTDLVLSTLDQSKS